MAAKDAGQSGYTSPSSLGIGGSRVVGGGNGDAECRFEGDEAIGAEWRRLCNLTGKPEVCKGGKGGRVVGGENGDAKGRGGRGPSACALDTPETPYPGPESAAR